NFLRIMGYSLEEVRGRHHSLFVEDAERHSAEYRAFWQKLGRGEYDAAQYKRVAKDGRRVWLQASYNPILDATGKPLHVVKYATDVTEQVRFAAQLNKAVQETKSVVIAANRGDLTQRVSVGAGTSALRGLSSGVNSLIALLTQL